MKKSGKCPKCDSTDIKVFPTATGESRGLAVGITIFSLLRPETFVCRDCGYAEEYFSQEQLKKMKK